MISVGWASIGAWVQGSALILAFYRPSLMNIMLYLGRWIAGLRFLPLAAVPPRIPLKTAFVLGDSYLRGTRKGSRDFSVKCGEDRAVCQSELREMAIRSLLCVDHPGGETGDVTVVGDKCEASVRAGLDAPQQLPGLHNGESALGSLGKHADESEFRDGACSQFRSALFGQALQLTGCPAVKLMIENAQGDESTHIEQEHHGKSARISATCLWVSLGPLGPAASTGQPVTGSLTIRARRRFPFLGVRTMRPLTTSASRASPASRHNFRRIGPGSTTCPLVESLVCTVGQSYQKNRRTRPWLAKPFRRSESWAHAWPHEALWGGRSEFGSAFLAKRH
jgi:hypothetical protein